MLHSVNLFAQNFPYKSFDVNDGLSTNYVYGVVQDSSGNIWAYTERGFNKFDGYRWTNYFPNRDIIKAVVSDKGKICAIDYNRRSYLIKEGEIIETIINSAEVLDIAVLDEECVCLLKEATIPKIKEDALVAFDTLKKFDLQNDFGATRIFSDNQQLYLYTQTKKEELIRLFSQTENNYKKIELSNFNYKGRRDFILVNSNSKVLLFNEISLFILDANLNVKASFDFSLMMDLIDTEILNPFIDKDENLWLGTRSKGLIFISKQNLSLSFISHPKESNIDFQEIGELDGQIILANNTGDLFHLKDDTLNAIFISSYKNIHRFFKFTNSGKFFFKNSRDNLLEYDFKKKEFIKHPNITNRLKDIFYNKSSRSYTISRTDGEVLEVSSIDKPASKLIADIQGHRLYKNKQLELLVAHSDSLRYLHDLDSVIVSLGVPSEITAINELERGYYLLGTNDNGLYSFNIKSKKLSSFLPRKSIVKIRIFDQQVFIVCVDGVYILNEELEILEEIHFDSDLGGNDIYKSGELIYIATSKGLLLTKAGSQTKLIDTVFDFNSITLYHNNVSIKNDYELAYDENNISISHSLNHLGSFDKVNYEYRLLPIQEEWKMTKDIITYFYDLDPNEYTFEIRGIDVYDNVHLPNEEITFKILKPYYKQSWFLFLMVFAILLSYYLLNLITKNIEHEKHLIKSSFIKRITDLKLQALQAQMNPHFVFNSISSIQYYIQTQNIINAEKYLLKFSNLIRYYINNSKEHFSELKEEINLLECFMDMENMRLEDAFNYHISIEESVSMDSAIPTMILQPIIDNLINESFIKKKSNKYSLKIVFKNLDNVLIVELINDGQRVSLFDENRKRAYINGSKNLEFVNMKVDILEEVFDLKASFEELPIDEENMGNRIIITFEKALDQDYVV